MTTSMLLTAREAMAMVPGRPGAQWSRRPHVLRDLARPTINYCECCQLEAL